MGNHTASLNAKERREKFVPKGVSTQHPFIITRAQGAWMWDENGKAYLDFAGGIGCLNVGSAHPEVVAAVQEQAEKLLHTCIHVTLNEPYLALVEQLCRIAPISGEKKALLANSGAEAVENAVKIARSFTERQAVLVFENAFHGRTNLGLALTSKIVPYKAGFGPFTPEVYRIPYAYCYRCPFGKTYGKCAYECVDAVYHAFETYVDPRSVAAMVVEPVQGEGGFIVPPPEYLPAIRQICREKGIIFIVDEVQTGFGRTGELFSVQHYESLDPDLITMAKSLGAGLPISAVVGKADIMDATVVGGLGGTFGGNPLAAAAALKVIELMERDDLPARARIIGQRMTTVLKELQRKYPAIGDVRAQGAMVAFELVKDPAQKNPFPEMCSAIVQKCGEKGLILLKAGIYDNVVRMLVPLVISEDDLETGLSILVEAIDEAMAEWQGNMNTLP
ncbi:4-aminobutyrate--2-oxoglutarate transaminase [Alicyclobacillus sp.]|uniref:4-aminobutyrate--2-oxoglutarate transaminase n=1 Tax=Alicyclobacillus sp. TaxID=61169 RepID=UPI0025BCBA1C|nr:4-aminobutyrate--2-oxoglutarate transaminase [Alicyclobacillus sp.]MCL6516727.1 4-aminobutyrate--2-oxoglutarate transaminase [Alicyclobacillus sp.]